MLSYLVLLGQQIPTQPRTPFRGPEEVTSSNRSLSSSISQTKSVGLDSCSQRPLAHPASLPFVTEGPEGAAGWLGRLHAEQLEVRFFDTPSPRPPRDVSYKLSRVMEELKHTKA